MNQKAIFNIISCIFIFGLIVSIISVAGNEPIQSYDMELNPSSAYSNPRTLSYDDYVDNDFIFPSIWLYSINLNTLDDNNIHEIEVTFVNMKSKLSVNILLRLNIHGVKPGETTRSGGQNFDITSKEIENIRSGNIIISLDHDALKQENYGTTGIGTVILDNFPQVEVFLFFSTSSNPTELIKINIKAYRYSGTIEDNARYKIDTSNTNRDEQWFFIQMFDFIISHYEVFLGISLGMMGFYLGDKILRRIEKTKLRKEGGNY